MFRLGYAEVTRMLPAARFALVEIGASAGLNLLWDNYPKNRGSLELEGGKSLI